MTQQYTHRGIGFFSEEKNAEQALKALQSSDFPMDQVSVIAKQLEKDVVAGGATTGAKVQGQDINASKRLPEQAVTGAVWGGLVGGLSALAFPGAGTVFAVGAVGTALATAVAGQGAGAAATMNLKESLKSLGIPQDKTGAYSDRLINEDFMLMVDGDQEALNQAESVLMNKSIQAWDVYSMPTA
jgi:hypothetical protein